MVFGSALESTRFARSSSPPASTTPVARPPSISDPRPQPRSGSRRPPRGSVGHRLGQPPDAAADESPLADPAARLLGGVVVQEHERGPGGRRAAGRVVDRMPAERGEDLVALEVLGQVLGGRGPEQIERVGDPARCAPRARRAPRGGRAPADAACRGSGGVVSMSGVISSAIRPARPRTPAARGRRRGRSGATSSCVAARSSSRCSAEPSASRLRPGPAGSTSIPRSTSRRSRHTGSRSMLST